MYVHCLCLFGWFQTPAEGAAPVLYVALSPALEGECGGGYWASGRREMTTPPTFDPQLQLSLWECSLQLLGLQQHETKGRLTGLNLVPISHLLSFFLYLFFFTALFSPPPIADIEAFAVIYVENTTIHHWSVVENLERFLFSFWTCQRRATGKRLCFLFNFVLHYEQANTHAHKHTHCRDISMYMILDSCLYWPVVKTKYTVRFVFPQPQKAFCSVTFKTTSSLLCCIIISLGFFCGGV